MCASVADTIPFLVPTGLLPTPLLAHSAHPCPVPLTTCVNILVLKGTRCPMVHRASCTSFVAVARPPAPECQSSSQHFSAAHTGYPIFAISVGQNGTPVDRGVPLHAISRNVTPLKIESFLYYILWREKIAHPCFL